MKILLCEDELVFAEHLSKEVQTYFAKYEEKAEVTVCRCGKEFEKEMEKAEQKGITYDLMFMDIHLGDLDGMDLIREYRKSEQGKTPVIFVSSMEDRVLDGYDVNAFSFLYKRNYRDKLSATLDRFRKEYGENTRITIQNTEGISILSLQEICYVEADGRKTRVHTDKSAIGDDRGILNFMKDLQGTNFLEVYKCIFVNVERISRVDSDSILLDYGETIPVSRRKRKAVLEAVMKNIGGKWR